MKIRRLWLVGLFLVGLWALSPALTAFAEAPHFAEILVDLWPEYDRPDMLVILHLQLPAGQSLPAQVDVRIPARVGEPHAVAVVEPDGSLINAPYQRTVEGEWAILSITASSPALQVEYYDTLERKGAQRHYTYRWPGFAAVEHFVLHIQRPPTAENFTLTPATAPAQREEDGLLYYTSDLGALAAGETFTLEIGYTKADDTLTVQQLQVQPSEPLVEAEGHLTASDWLPWVLGGLGLALIVGGLVWYWRTGVNTPSASEKPRRRRRARKPAATAPTEVRYCPQCGTRAQPGDRFCRNCGAPLR